MALSRTNARFAGGFSLIELMIVVAVVGFLFTIALPAYQNSMLKGRRADGKAALMDAANRQERLILDRSTYTTDMSDLGFSANPMISPDGNYSVAAAVCSGGAITSCYKLTATAIAAQAKDSKCQTLTLDYKGAKESTPGSNNCW
ncbi:MAG: type IV pilus assembly protein PilE [Halioglobus sp.]|jgi:type IV pilus assembly protein PilE